MRGDSLCRLVLLTLSAACLDAQQNPCGSRLKLHWRRSGYFAAVKRDGLRDRFRVRGRAGGRTAATTLTSDVFPPNSLSRVAQLRDVRNHAVGELHILRSFAAAQQRITELRSQITIIWHWRWVRVWRSPG